jgi:diamine N-acetyltransferase
MAKTVRLKPVTAANWEDVADLELTKDQAEFVASNVYSLAESKFDPDARPRAIYAGRKVVGFLMYDVQGGRGGGRKATIYRFMIDRRKQGKGYGRAALERAVAEIRRLPKLRSIVISYMPKNRQVRRLYRSLGFVERGRDEDGEMIAELTLR